jgi:pimeloyl-ACP methyl ester carboxylesterase
LGFAGLVVFVLLAGVIYQFAATKIDAYRWYPPPSDMVDVGGSIIHLHCTGEQGSAPTVVMEIGAGGMGMDWQPVQPGVAKFARVCTYDRGGAGWNDPGPRPRTSQRFVGELHALLSNAGIEGSYVLVGHSLGGNNAQLYASRYPDEVAGMVLVDSQFYNMSSYLDPQLQNAYEQLVIPSPAYSLWTKFLATIGVTRLPYTFGGQTDERIAISTHAKNTYAPLAAPALLMLSAYRLAAAAPSTLRAVAAPATRAATVATGWAAPAPPTLSAAATGAIQTEPVAVWRNAPTAVTAVAVVPSA